MTLVIADCVPRKTPWPRGLLLGIAIALKLTPAVFLLYFLLRRDTRALLTSVASAIAATAIGFVVAPRDSWQYWTETVHDTDRIGTATYLTNQNIAGILARLGIGETPRFVIWLVACFAVLGLTVWAVRRVLRSGTRLRCARANSTCSPWRASRCSGSSCRRCRGPTIGCGRFRPSW